MRTSSTALTSEERHILILAALHPHGNHLSNLEISRRLGIPVSRVKTLMHRACLKLKAHNRIEAIFFAMKRGDIRLDEVYSLDEIAEMLSSLSPDTLKRIADIMREESETENLPTEAEQIIRSDRRLDARLTNREHDVLILAGRGLTNREIADKLCISTSAVRTFLNRACTKLGASKRADAVVLALKQREIGVAEITSPDEVVQGLAPLGAESLEKMARLRAQQPIPAAPR
ncbi:MAG: LuxR C-terminal-related transcriptional regulator [Dehalococcoidia bacterium]|nr:LuxR C-terminal-related transcriptional regulator [Dehalococcoidia bacterium]